MSRLSKKLSLLALSLLLLLGLFAGIRPAQVWAENKAYEYKVGDNVDITLSYDDTAPQDLSGWLALVESGSEVTDANSISDHAQAVRDDFTAMGLTCHIILYESDGEGNLIPNHDENDPDNYKYAEWYAPTQEKSAQAKIEVRITGQAKKAGTISFRTARETGVSSGSSVIKYEDVSIVVKDSDSPNPNPDNPNPDPGTTTLPNELYISKKLDVSEMPLPKDETFTFTFTKTAENTAGPDLDSASISYKAHETAVVCSSNLLTDIQQKFTEANITFGNFSYTVTETAGSTENMSYSQAQYTVTFQVKNGTITAIVVDKNKKDDGQDATGKINDVGSTDSNEFRFVNTYNEELPPPTGLFLDSFPFILLLGIMAVVLLGGLAKKKTQSF